MNVATRSTRARVRGSRAALVCAMAWAAAVLLGMTPARGQELYGPSPTPPRVSAESTIERALLPTGGASFNPISVLSAAGETVNSASGREGGDGMSTAINVMVLLTVITLVPSIVLMTTCFVRIIVVLGLLKQAIGAQQLPPAQVTFGLALVMTLLVMSPTVERIRAEAIEPYRQGEIRGYDELWDKAKAPMRDFMFDQIEASGNWSSVYMVLNYRGVDTSHPEDLTRADVDMVSLIPAFMLSELKVAFLMGFKVYLPFLVIDMVIATVLVSMSMMMLPPVLISLPFKLLLFVMVDGWQLVTGGLLASFHAPGAG